MNYNFGAKNTTNSTKMCTAIYTNSYVASTPLLKDSLNLLIELNRRKHNLKNLHS